MELLTPQFVSIVCLFLGLYGIIIYQSQKKIQATGKLTKETLKLALKIVSMIEYLHANLKVAETASQTPSHENPEQVTGFIYRDDEDLAEAEAKNKGHRRGDI